jgi:hypothetical protein
LDLFDQCVSFEIKFIAQSSSDTGVRFPLGASHTAALGTDLGTGVSMRLQKEILCNVTESVTGSLLGSGEVVIPNLEPLALLAVTPLVSYHSEYGQWVG